VSSEFFKMDSELEVKKSKLFSEGMISKWNIPTYIPEQQISSTLKTNEELAKYLMLPEVDLFVIEGD